MILFSQILDEDGESREVSCDRRRRFEKLLSCESPRPESRAYLEWLDSGDFIFGSGLNTELFDVS